LEAAIRKEFEIEVSLREGVGGIFEVAINEEVAFSNLDEGRFPENEEIFQKIRKRMASA
jgi:selT/selW/selH-like putative selenoprotein